MWSAFFFSRYNALTAPLSKRDPLLGFGTLPCASRPRLSGNKASEENQLRSDETNKTVRAQQRRHAIHSPREMKPTVISLLCHLTRKDRSEKCVISQDRDRSLNQTETPVTIVATEHKMRVDLWNFVTTCGMALRLEILIAGSSVSHQAVVMQCCKGIFKHFSYCLGWRLDPFCTLGDDPRQARSCSSEFCL